MNHPARGTCRAWARACLTLSSGMIWTRSPKSTTERPRRPGERRAKRSAVSGQWSAVSGQRSAVSGQRSAVSEDYGAGRPCRGRSQHECTGSGRTPQGSGPDHIPGRCRSRRGGLVRARRRMVLRERGGRSGTDPRRRPGLAGNGHARPPLCRCAARPDPGLHTGGGLDPSTRPGADRPRLAGRRGPCSPPRAARRFRQLRRDDHRGRRVRSRPADPRTGAPPADRAAEPGDPASSRPAGPRDTTAQRHACTDPRRGKWPRQSRRTRFQAVRTSALWSDPRRPFARRAARAAFHPQAPCTPPPGCAEALAR